MPQGHSHETTELKLLFLNEGYATCKVARQTGVAFFLVAFSWRARKRSLVKAEFLRAQKFATSEKLKSNQPPVCHRQY
jgi:hypothetical protein